MYSSYHDRGGSNGFYQQQQPIYRAGGGVFLGSGTGSGQMRQQLVERYQRHQGGEQQSPSQPQPQIVHKQKRQHHGGEGRRGHVSRYLEQPHSDEYIDYYEHQGPRDAGYRYDQQPQHQPQPQSQSLQEPPAAANFYWRARVGSKTNMNGKIVGLHLLASLLVAQTLTFGLGGARHFDREIWVDDWTKT
jgi:hypothetical protein